MSGINKVILVGRLGRNPERKETRDRKEFSVFSVATSKKIRDEERTTWHSIVVWNENTARYVNQYACKGTLIYVEGEIEVRTYEDGQTHYVTEIVVGQYNGDVQILKDGQARTDSEPRTRTYQEENQKENPVTVYHPDDDIPFFPPEVP